MFGVGTDLCGSSSPTPLMRQGHLQQAAQDRIQAGLEYLQRRRLHNLPGQPVPVLRHPQREEVLPHVQTELAVLVCAHCPLSCRWALLKRLWPHLPDTHPSDICKYILGPLVSVMATSEGKEKAVWISADVRLAKLLSIMNTLNIRLWRENIVLIFVCEKQNIYIGIFYSSWSVIWTIENEVCLNRTDLQN